MEPEDSKFAERKRADCRAPVWHLPVRWKRLRSDVTDVAGTLTGRQTQTKAARGDLSRLCST